MTDFLHTQLQRVSPRQINFFVAAMVLLTLLFVLYLQHVEDLAPCNLCIFQRIGLIGSGLVFLIAALHNPAQKGQRIYAGLSLIPTIAGAAVALRHIWIQHLPADQVPACGPNLDYLLDVFPLQEAISMVLRGSGECAEEQWRFILNIPEWSLFGFVVLAGFAILQLTRRA